MNTEKAVKEPPDYLLAPTMEQELAMIDDIVESFDRRGFFDLSRRNCRRVWKAS